MEVGTNGERDRRRVAGTSNKIVERVGSVLKYGCGAAAIPFFADSLLSGRTRSPRACAFPS